MEKARESRIIHSSKGVSLMIQNASVLNLLNEMRYFFFKYLTAEIELYYSNVHLATPLSDKRLPIIVQSYKLTPVTARIGHCDEIWRDLRTTAKEIAIRFRTVTV